jgi:hypothetical protein
VINPRRVVRDYAKKIASRLKFSIATNIRDRRIRIPIVNGIGFDTCKGRIEAIDLSLEQILPRVCGTFIDVGANIGQTLYRTTPIQLRCERPVPISADAFGESKATTESDVGFYTRSRLRSLPNAADKTIGADLRIRHAEIRRNALQLLASPDRAYCI